MVVASVQAFQIIANLLYFLVIVFHRKYAGIQTKSPAPSKKGGA